ncbi:hypothetical protein OROMI_030658 [Orobanche minor]
MHQKMYLKALVLYLLTWIATGAYQPPENNIGDESSIFFKVYGEVYPRGHYTVIITFGQANESYVLDIDTGNALTWLQCDTLFSAPHIPYIPQGYLTCDDPICGSLQLPVDRRCSNSEDQCDYLVKYADHGSFSGSLVKDSVQLHLPNRTLIEAQLVFGCGYSQESQNLTRLPYVDGVLGLGKGNSSILTQLHSMGRTRNVFGHCFSRQGGGGYLYFGGDDLHHSNSSEIVWTPSLNQRDNYNAGSADLEYFGLQATNNSIIKGLEGVVFDSGSTYTYLTSQAYGDLVSMIKKDLEGNDKIVAVEDGYLPMCWKGAESEPFQTIDDAIKNFKLLVLSFRNEETVEFMMGPESYLVFTCTLRSTHLNRSIFATMTLTGICLIQETKIACLGILNGTTIGLGNTNIIGDISMQDNLVIYDNEKNRVGWAPANCSTDPKP